MAERDTAGGDPISRDAVDGELDVVCGDAAPLLQVAHGAVDGVAVATTDRIEAAPWHYALVTPCEDAGADAMAAALRPNGPKAVATIAEEDGGPLKRPGQVAADRQRVERLKCGR